MSYAGDDLTPLLVPPDGAPLGFRKGTVLAYNQQTGANTLMVDGAIFTDLAILNTSEALLLTPGANVGILTTGAKAKSWFILGRITVPGTPDALSALAMVSNRIVSNEVVGQGTRSSAAFGDLTGSTVGPTVSDVIIGNSGKAFVIVGATISSGGAAYSGGLMGYDITGATTRAANVTDSLEDGMSAESFSFSNSRGVLETGLNPGAHTFTAKYASAAGGTAITFENRNIIVFAL
jgi:hypothetical protein